MERTINKSKKETQANIFKCESYKRIDKSIYKLNKITVSFSNFDLNNDGKIDEQEFKQIQNLLQSMGAEKEFKDYDTNNDGSIDKQEFEEIKNI